MCGNLSGNEDDVKWVSSRAFEILSCQVNELPFNDISRVEALELAFDCCCRLGMHSQAIDNALQTLGILRSCYGVYNAKYGIHLANIGKQYYAIGDHASAEKFLQMALSSLSVTHGESHPVFRDVHQFRRMNRRRIPGPQK